ncbi:uncharacterized protein LOC135216310 [Macrobrachium nipponense]|uniref:uncharacterized protein LOC135216310 n=1 Tax=Macrobrachium nipponense TaxID=159736 RepID=UPI0030C86EED
MAPAMMTPPREATRDNCTSNKVHAMDGIGTIKPRELSIEIILRYKKERRDVDECGARHDELDKATRTTGTSKKVHGRNVTIKPRELTNSSVTESKRDNQADRQEEEPKKKEKSGEEQKLQELPSPAKGGETFLKRGKTQKPRKKKSKEKAQKKTVRKLKKIVRRRIVKIEELENTKTTGDDKEGKSKDLEEIRRKCTDKQCVNENVGEELKEKREEIKNMKKKVRKCDRLEKQCAEKDRQREERERIIQDLTDES